MCKLQCKTAVWNTLCPAVLQVGNILVNAKYSFSTTQVHLQFTKLHSSNLLVYFALLIMIIHNGIYYNYNINY